MIYSKFSKNSRKTLFWGTTLGRLDFMKLFVWQQHLESAKLHALHVENVLTYLACSRANGSCMLTCSHANVSCMLMCSRANVSCLACLCAHVPTCLACLHAHVPTSLVRLHTHVPTCLACLHLKMFCILMCSWEKPGKMDNVYWYRSYTQTCLAFSFSPVLIQRH